MMQTMPIIGPKAPSIGYLCNAAKSILASTNATFELINGDTGEPAYNKQFNEIIKSHSYPPYYLYLNSVDTANKIAVIKETQNITGLGLDEAKALVKAAPVAYKDFNAKNTGAYTSIEAVKEAANKLEAAGASVDIYWFTDDVTCKPVRYK